MWVDYLIHRQLRLVLRKEKRKRREPLLLACDRVASFFPVCLNSAMTSSTLYYVPAVGAEEANSSIGYHLVTQNDNTWLCFPTASNRESA